MELEIKILLVITTVSGFKWKKASIKAARVNEINAASISLPFRLTSGLWDLIETLANIIPDIVAIKIKINK